MQILFLAPQPFYQERGTPIAIHKLLSVLSARGEQIDVLTYHEGSDVEYAGVKLFRIPAIPLVHNIRPGFSWKKLVCDVVMLIKAVQLAAQKRYQLVHAVEESVFIAMVLKLLFKIPYVYDMDSLLSQQIVERRPLLAPVSSVLGLCEGLAIKHAQAVVPVCDALAVGAQKHMPRKMIVLPDISLLEETASPAANDLKTELNIQGTLLMYVGNLERYQGIDLLLESFALALEQTDSADLVIIGGTTSAIQAYREKARSLGIEQKTHFLGPKPVQDLAAYLAQADILVSPRITGNNTPMKVYSYLDSGKALLATDLPTHTQVLDSQVALLAEPVPEKFSDAIVRLVEDAPLRQQLGASGKQLIKEKFSYDIFYQRLNSLYDWLQTGVEPKQSHVVSSDT